MFKLEEESANKWARCMSQQAIIFAHYQEILQQAICFLPLNISTFFLEVCFKLSPYILIPWNKTANFKNRTKAFKMYRYLKWIVSKNFTMDAATPTFDRIFLSCHH